jgi:hypothetical protein
MTLLSNTVLAINKSLVSYEILLSGAILIFKPFFYHIEENLPCIILIRSTNGWKLEEHLEKVLEDQIMDDIACLRIK